jgi:hypothetical protein
LSLITGSSSLKWDIIDIDFPFRYFVSDSLRNGNFTFWNPDQHCGYPQSSILISWYPLIWIYSLFGHYTYGFVVFDFLLHVYLCGVGFYFLAKRFNYDTFVAMCLAIGYMLSGFIIGNAQHFGWIIGAAWLPFVLFNYLDFLKKQSWQNIAKLTIFSYLLLSGGYPAIVIIAFYLCLVILIWFWITHRKQTNVMLFLRQHICLFLSIVAAAIVLIYATLQILPEVDRLSGMSIEQSLQAPFTLESMISTVFPYAVTAGAEAFPNTDISMVNTYFGILALLFMLYSLTIKTSSLSRIFFIFGVWSLIAAMHMVFPVRQWLHSYVPMMDLFRLSGVFRLFFIMGCLLFAGQGIQAFLQNRFHRKRFLILIISLNAVLYLILILSMTGILSSGYVQIILNQMVWHTICFAGLLAIFFFVTRSYMWRGIALVALFALDMGISTDLTAKATTYQREFSAKNYYAMSDRLPKGYPVPEQRPVLENSNPLDLPVWYNRQMFDKNVYCGGYSPYELISYKHLQWNERELFDSLMRNPVVFMQNENSEVVIRQFFPYEIIVETQSLQSDTLVLLQNYFNGWRASLNGENLPIVLWNNCFMAVPVPEGTHTIYFTYKNPRLLYTATISFFWLLFCIAFLFIRNPELRNQNDRATASKMQK